MDDTIVNRVNSKDMSTYSMGSETGHGEPAVQSAFDKLIAAVVEALQQGDHDPGSELKANKAGTRDLLSGTTRNPDGTVFYGEDAVCLVELNTESSFNPDVLEKFNEQALISHAAKVKLFNSSTRKVHKTSIEMIGDPVAQICCYMVSRECRYGILSNWAFTFFLKLELDELGSMVLHCSDRFSPFTRAVREDEGVCAAGNEFLGTVVSKVDEETPAASLIQASTLFVWLAMRDRVVGREDDVDMKKALRARAEKTSGLEDHPIGSGSSFSLFKGRRRDNGTGNVERNGEGAKGGKMHGVVDGVALTFDYWHVSSVVSVLFEQGIGYKQTTVTDLETGEEISDCFAKCIAVDDADARNAYSHQCAMHHFENEVAMYEGPALGLQGTVVPAVVHVGEFDMGAGKQAVLVTRNAGHALSSREGKRIARAEGLVAVKKRVHAALGSLHEAGIIHGDMGLRNVTIREDGGVCLIDLGSAFCGGPSGAERDLELFDKDFDATFKAELA
ncbi:Hormonally up-regulated neu tumor-associated kinase, partial [Hondaea fermentalgiana]